MDNRLKTIVDNLDSMLIGLDEPFQFHCTMCGKCCINREDILLNPRDMYTMAKALGISPEELFNRCCEVYIGSDSRIPIVRLKPRGPVKRCPLLKDRKCSVHEAKPTVCALFPLGRCVMVARSENEIGPGDVKIILNPPNCGDSSETHTPREWLTAFGIPIQDTFFIKWQQTVIRLGKALQRLEKMRNHTMMNAVWSAAFSLLYLSYTTDREFMPQFEQNTDFLIEALQTAAPGKGGDGHDG